LTPTLDAHPDQNPALSTLNSFSAGIVTAGLAGDSGPPRARLVIGCA
jgi:hypothetical protein